PPPPHSRGVHIVGLWITCQQIGPCFCPAVNKNLNDLAERRSSVALPRSSDLKRRTRKSDCALGESERGGYSSLDQRRPPVRSVPILHTASAKSPNQPRYSAGFRKVCRNCTGTLLFRQMIAKFLCPSDASGTASPLVGQRSGQIEQRHCRCSTEHRMSVGLRGSFDAGGLLCRTNCHTQSRRGHPRRPQRSTSLSQIHRAQKVWFSNPFQSS